MGRCGEIWALHHLLDLRARPADVRALELEGVALDEDLLAQESVAAQRAEQEARRGGLACNAHIHRVAG